MQKRKTLQRKIQRDSAKRFKNSYHIINSSTSYLEPPIVSNTEFQPISEVQHNQLISIPKRHTTFNFSEN